MKLLRARVQNYRSILDSGWFDVEEQKTILVGTNESGKTALLRALQTLNPPAGEGELEAFRDFPRSDYGRIRRGDIAPEDVVIVEGDFAVDENLQARLAAIDARFGTVQTVRIARYLANNRRVSMDGVTSSVRWRTITRKFGSLRSNAEKAGGQEATLRAFDVLSRDLDSDDFVLGEVAEKLSEWLREIRPGLKASDQATVDTLLESTELPGRHAKAREAVLEAAPLFVYYSSFTTVRPRINLSLLATRIQANDVDADLDAGNVALFKLLRLDAAELSAQGKASVKSVTSQEDAEQVQNQLAKRQHTLAEAAKDLTSAVRKVWGEKHKLEFRADGDWVRVVVVENDVDIELDQRSAGFVWLVSFYVVFKAETADNLANAILLLDEPGLSLHALKQRQFRETVSSIATGNQTLYTTHSPFMVGPDELHLVRVVELRSRKGTRVHQGVTSADPAALFPLQAALGYSMAQSLFAQQFNLVCEGLTDFWYIEGMSNLLGERKRPSLREDIAIVPAGGASKVAYFAVLLRAQKLQVAALLDSDTEGEQAAGLSEFVYALGRTRILRTGDFTAKAGRSTTEDLLRMTLVHVAKAELGWDVHKTALSQPERPVLEIFQDRIGKNFSKYQLAKAFVRWTGAHSHRDLDPAEVSNWALLFDRIERNPKVEVRTRSVVLRSGTSTNPDLPGRP